MGKKHFRDARLILFALIICFGLIAIVTIFDGASNSPTGHAINNQTVTEQDASLSLGVAKQTIDDMEKSGFNVVRLKDLLEEARREMTSKNYGRVFAISNEIISLKQKAFEVQDKIKSARLKIDETKKYGFNITDAEQLLNFSIVEFTLENYEGSESYLNNSIDKLSFIAGAELEIIVENLNKLRNYSLEKSINITRLENTIRDGKNALPSDAKKINVLKAEFIDLNKSIYILIGANSDIKDMAEAGFGAKRVNDILNEAKFALELGYYGKIEDISKSIKNLRLKAFEIQESFKITKAKIEEAKSYGLDLNEPETLLNQSIKEFYLENYEDSEKILKKSFEETEKLIADSLLFGTISKSELRFNALNFLKIYWWAVLIGIAVISILAIVSFQKASILVLESRLKSLEKEKDAIVDLIKNAQNAYFKERSMDKATYDVTINRHQNRIIQIREQMPLVKAKLARQREMAKLRDLSKIILKKSLKK